MKRDVLPVSFRMVLFASLVLLGSHVWWNCGCSRSDHLIREPSALVDSVLAHYGSEVRSYAAEFQVIVPADQGHGYFPGSLWVVRSDSAEIRVERGREEWLRVTPQTVEVKRRPGKPLVLLRDNVNHEPVLERELYVLLPDIFSWLLDTYRISLVRVAPDTGYCVIALPRKKLSPVGRAEIDVEPKTFKVREVRLYAKNGDLGGRIAYYDFSTTYGYWIPRSIAVDFVVGGTMYDELYRLLRLRRLPLPPPSGADNQ